MKTKIFTSIFATIVLVVASMNSYAQEDTRYLVVEDLQGAEKAAFYLGDIPAPVSGILTLKSAEGKPYEYKTSDHRFRFDIRPYGNATSNEEISVEKWGVSYFGGSLRFTQTVNQVSIYSFSGALINRPSGSGTDYNTFLLPGNYIVSTDRGALKININSNLSGGSAAEIKTKSFSVNDPPIGLRSDISLYSEAAPYYWNISSGNNTFPLDINTIGSFHFNENGDLILTPTNSEDSISVENYNSSTFAEEPAVNEIDLNWDFSKQKFWGGSYGFDYQYYVQSQMYTRLIAGIVHNNGIIIYDFVKDEEVYVPNNKISPDIWGRQFSGQNPRISRCDDPTEGRYIALSYVNDWGNVVVWDSVDGKLSIAVGVIYYEESRGSSCATTSISLTPEGVKMVITSVNDNQKYTHIFKGWNPE